jgi:hypothetical protein
MMHLGTLVVGEDLATAVSGAFNIGHFARYAWRSDSRGRRIGAAALTLVSGAAVVEAVFSEVLFWGAGLSAEAWALARLPLLGATLFISILILRRLRS